MGLFRGERASYKPFAYPFCHEFFELQNNIHWVPKEVSLSQDVKQWYTSLTISERNLLEQVQVFLANADTDIANVYVNKYLPNLLLPEVRSALLSIANIEAIHQSSYSYTIDTLGMSETSYSAFLDIPEMWAKHVFVTEERKENLSDVQKFLLDIAICSAFGEGLQLFGAFAIILSFQRRGLMNGLGTLTSFIARDEQLHCEFMSKVFHTICAENPGALDAQLIEHIVSAVSEALELEEHFIDLAFALGDVEGLTPESVKEYLIYLANKRLHDLGLTHRFTKYLSNPFPWMDELLGGTEHTNFFENRPTSYSKVNYVGSWDEVWSAYGGHS